MLLYLHLKLALHRIKVMVKFMLIIKLFFLYYDFTESVASGVDLFQIERLALFIIVTDMHLTRVSGPVKLFGQKSNPMEYTIFPLYMVHSARTHFYHIKHVIFM